MKQLKELMEAKTAIRKRKKRKSNTNEDKDEDEAK
jgi:hypothetical protein